MASRRRSGRSAVSYAEPSDSDSNESDSLYISNASDISRRSKAQTRSRRPPLKPPVTQPSPMRNKRSKLRQSYKETSSSDMSESDMVAQPTKRRKTRSSEKISAPSPINARARDRPSSRTQAPVKTSNRPLVTDGNVPAWQTLPYEVLLSVFRYAIHPLHTDQDTQLPSVAWAIKASALCKAFLEPALSALYESPPLHNLHQPFGLLRLLESESKSTMIDYALKIKRLHLNAASTLAYTVAKRHFHLTDLLQNLPRLQSIDFVGLRDRPPYFTQSSQGTWAYPRDMFKGMNACEIRLKSFHLNGDMLVSDVGADLLDSAFAQPCLERLRHLILSNMTLDRQDDRTLKQYPSIWPVALSSLQELRALELRNCSINKSWALLDHLPNRLHKLVIVNCPDLDAISFRPFLTKHGQELRALELHHSNALDLTFLPELRNCCPKLEVLRCDLTYYSNALVFKSSSADANYDQLLQPDDIPTWPLNLRELELLNLDKWSSEAAEGLLQSVCDAAGDLKDLRYLTIEAIVRRDWRDRAQFRDKMVSKFRHIFLRRSEPPNPHLESLKAYRLWQEARNDQDERKKDDRKAMTIERRTTRALKADTDESEDEQLVVQGRCERVDIVIHNSKKAEMQFTANDFLDSERSGDDEDWTAENDGPSSPKYAW